MGALFSFDEPCEAAASSRGPRKSIRELEHAQLSKKVMDHWFSLHFGSRDPHVAAFCAEGYDTFPAFYFGANESGLDWRDVEITSSTEVESVSL